MKFGNTCHRYGLFRDLVVAGAFAVAMASRFAISAEIPLVPVAEICPFMNGPSLQFIPSLTGGEGWGLALRFTSKSYHSETKKDVFTLGAVLPNSVTSFVGAPYKITYEQVDMPHTPGLADWLPRITRDILLPNNSQGQSTHYSLSYQTWDPGVARLYNYVNVYSNHVTLYLSENFTWVESTNLSNSLAVQYGTPMFFGYGRKLQQYLQPGLNNALSLTWTAKDVISDQIDTNFTRAQCRPIEVYKFKYSDLQAYLQNRSKAHGRDLQEWTSDSPPYPFMNHGPKAAALTMAIR
jgi:hypothetical protein